MDLWSGFVGVFYATLLALAQLYGGSMGAAILTLSVTIRLALLPVLIHAARRSRRRQRILEAIEPEVDRLKKRYARKPARLADELRALRARHGVKLVDPSAVGGLVAQALPAVGLYAAIGRGLGRAGRFLWISDLARPDVLVAGIAAATTWAAVQLSPAAGDHSRLLAIVPCVITLVVLSRLSAGLGLYVVGSNAVSILQGFILRKTEPAA